jgi:hypothetical protein
VYGEQSGCSAKTEFHVAVHKYINSYFSDKKKSLTKMYFSKRNFGETSASGALGLNAITAV